MKFSQFMLSATFKCRVLFASLFSQSECCYKFTSFSQIAQMSNLIGLCVCASGYSRVAVLEDQLPPLENLTEFTSVDAEPEHHRFTLASGDVQGLSKIGSVAKVGRNCIPVTEHCVSSCLFLCIQTTSTDFCRRFQFWKPLRHICSLAILNLSHPYVQIHKDVYMKKVLEGFLAGVLCCFR